MRGESTVLVKTSVVVDVSSVVPMPGRHQIRGWVCAPRELRPTDQPRVVLCCLAGGRCTTSYFDLDVEGQGNYSMAEHLAAQGFVVVAIDHLGVGESSAVDDLFLVTPDVASSANHHAFGELLARLRAGSLTNELSAVPSSVAVGVGHSMGGMLTLVQQAHHHTYDAVANLGHGGDGLPQLLTRDELNVVGDSQALRAKIVDLARARFTPGPGRKAGARFPTPSTPQTCQRPCERRSSANNPPCCTRVGSPR
jgi:pimeloyl-ACP methyl ester carboxylesterase